MKTFSRFAIFAIAAALLLVAAPAPAADAPDVRRNPARCLALTMYWEAKGEGRDGMLAVAHVVLNRVAHRQFPNDVCGVVLEGGPVPPCQFHWYCNGRDNRPVEAAPWALAQDMALAMLKGRPTDTTGGALFFHHRALDNPWRLARTRTARIGAHVYYR